MKTVDIEQLVRWAYREELPKAQLDGPPVAGFRAGWDGVGRYGELLAVVQEPDIANRYGLFPDAVEREPHPDAVAVFEAVERLADCAVVLPEGWNPLEDMGDLGGEGAAAITRGLARLCRPEGRGPVARVSADGRKAVLPEDGAASRLVLRSPVSRLVIRHAILGGCPDWAADAPERRVEAWPNGSPRWWRRVVQVSDGAFGPAIHEVEVDGFDHKRRMPMPDAYQRVFLDPDPADAVHGRGEYELWHAALGLLAEDLAGRLAGHTLAQWPRAARPWLAGGDAAPGRILASLLVCAGESPPQRAMGQNMKQEAA